MSCALEALWRCKGWSPWKHIFYFLDKLGPLRSLFIIKDFFRGKPHLREIGYAVNELICFAFFLLHKIFQLINQVSNYYLLEAEWYSLKNPYSWVLFVSAGWSNCFSSNISNTTKQLSNTRELRDKFNRPKILQNVGTIKILVNFQNFLYFLTAFLESIFVLYWNNQMNRFFINIKNEGNLVIENNKKIWFGKA